MLETLIKNENFGMIKIIMKSYQLYANCKNVMITLDKKGGKDVFAFVKYYL